MKQRRLITINACINVTVFEISSSIHADEVLIQDCPGPGCPARSTNIEGADPIPFVSDDLAVNVRIEFDFDSTRMTSGSIEGLQRVCSAIRETDIKLLVIGHTDGNGSEQYNKALSAERAEEVVVFMVNECGISPDRLRAVGLGESACLTQTIQVVQKTGE